MFYIVIHLAKPKPKEEVKAFTSCNEAFLAGVTDASLTVNINGE